jgi:hypothetical protein
VTSIDDKTAALLLQFEGSMKELSAKYAKDRTDLNSQIARLSKRAALSHFPELRRLRELASCFVSKSRNAIPRCPDPSALLGIRIVFTYA